MVYFMENPTNKCMIWVVKPPIFGSTPNNKKRHPYAPIPSGNGLGVGFGYLNTFSQGLWSTRDKQKKKWTRPSRRWGHVALPNDMLIILSYFQNWTNGFSVFWDPHFFWWSPVAQLEWYPGFWFLDLYISICNIYSIYCDVWRIFTVVNHQHFLIHHSLGGHFFISFPSASLTYDLESVPHFPGSWSQRKQILLMAGQPGPPWLRYPHDK